MSDPALTKASLDDLIALCLRSDDGSEDYWAAVRELHCRGDRATFEKARALTLEPGDQERILGASLLAQLGYREDCSYRDESLPLLTTLASAEQSSRVVGAAITALGHMGAKSSAPAVLAHVGHRHTEVRFAVAVALPSVAEDPPSRAVLNGLLTLMADADNEVRDWATFGLASQLDVDSPDVRDALFARIDDDGDVGAEALVGLARRRDPRAFAQILHWLKLHDPDAGTLVLEAAEELADPRCLPALYALRAKWDDVAENGALTAAIAACERNGSAPVSAE